MIKSKSFGQLATMLSEKHGKNRLRSHLGLSWRDFNMRLKGYLPPGSRQWLFRADWAEASQEITNQNPNGSSEPTQPKPNHA